jgi:hypothetical protein
MSKRVTVINPSKPLRISGGTARRKSGAAARRRSGSGSTRRNNPQSNGSKRRRYTRRNNPNFTNTVKAVGIGIAGVAGTHMIARYVPFERGTIVDALVKVAIAYAGAKGLQRTRIIGQQTSDTLIVGGVAGAVMQLLYAYLPNLANQYLPNYGTVAVPAQLLPPAPAQQVIANTAQAAAAGAAGALAGYYDDFQSAQQSAIEVRPIALH